MGVSYFTVTSFAAGEGIDRGMCGVLCFAAGEGTWVTFHCDKFCSWGRNGQGYVWVYHILL